MSTSGTLNTTAFEGRYLQFAWTRKSYSTQNNTTTISWTVKGAGTAQADWYMCAPVRVTINGSVVKTVTTRTKLFIGTQIAAGETVIPHNNDGTKAFTAKVEAALYYSEYNVSGTKAFTLDTIPRLSSLSVPDGGILGTAQSLTINRVNSSYTDTVSYKCGTATGTIATKTSSTSLSFTPPSTLASQAPSGQSVNIEFTITTYNGDSIIGSQKITKSYAIPSSVAPTISAFTLTEGGDVGNFTVYIYGKSKITWSVTAVGSGGSEIAGYSVNIAGINYSSATGTTDFLYVSGNQTATVTVTDTRGRTATRTASFRVYSYSLPIINKFECIRTSNGTNPDDSGTKLRVELNFIVADVNNQNTVSFGFGYREQGSTGSYSSLQHTISANTFSYNGAQVFNTVFDPEKFYEIRFAIIDKFGTTYKYGYLNSSNFAITVSPNKKSIAFFGKWLKEGFECFKKAYFPKGIDSLNTPKLGDYEKINTSTDLDDITKLGTYYVPNISSVSNLPVAEKGILTVICGESGIYDGSYQSSIMQIYETFNGLTKFRRQAIVTNTREEWFFGNWTTEIKIVEENTSTSNGIDWTWRTWSNGDVELWGTQSVTVDIDGAWGSGVYGSGDREIPNGTYPVTFTSEPFVQITVNRGSNGNMWIGTSGQGTTDLKTHTPYVQLFRGTVLANVNAQIAYYVKGKIN